MFLKASYLIFGQAKKLREDLTPAELILWSYLKQKPLGYKFRRQHPISTYIVDFYCHPLKLIIEVDGNIHENADIAKYDKERQEYLESQGLNFLRFTNKEVDKELDNVILVVEKYIVDKTALVKK